MFLNANILGEEKLEQYINEAVIAHESKVAISPEISKDTKDIINGAVLEVMDNYINHAI